MKFKFKGTPILSRFLLILMISVSPASAYVLQGRHVLDLMIEKLGPAKSLFVSEKIIVYRLPTALVDAGGGGLPTAADTLEENSAFRQPPSKSETVELEAQELDGSLKFVFSRAFRSDTRSSTTERILVSVGGRSLTIVDGSIVSETANRLDHFKDILLLRSRERLAEFLLRMGVDVSISSLGRFEDRIAFVIGAQYPDESVSQLWVDKDTLLPLRLIVNGVGVARNSAKVEIRYLIWWKIGQSQYPSRIEFYQDDHLVRLSQAKNFEENPTFSEELFDIDYLQMVYPRASVQPIEAEAAEEPNEIQQTIENFKRIFE